MLVIVSKVCPACRGQHRPHTYKEGCKKFGEQEPQAGQPAEAPAPAASSSSGDTRKRAAGDQEKATPKVTRKRAVLGDPDLEVDSSRVNKGSSSSSSSAHPEPQVEEDVPPVPEAELPAPPESKEEDVKIALRKIHDKLKDETELLQASSKALPYDTEELPAPHFSTEASKGSL